VSFGVGKFGDLGEGKISIEGGGGERPDFGQIDRTIGREVFAGEIDEGDPADDQLGVVGGDVDDFFELESDAERAFGDEGGVDLIVVVFGQAGGFKLGGFVGIACRALVAFFNDSSGEVVEGPFTGIEDVAEGVAVDGIGSGHHAEQDGVGTEVSDAGKGSEVGFSIGTTGANEADRLGAGQSGGELDAGEFVHFLQVGRGDDHGGRWRCFTRSQGEILRA